MVENPELKKLSIIRQMAELRLTGDLTKNDFSDYSKTKAIDTLFDSIRKAYKNASTESTIAATKMNIAKFIKAESQFFGDATLKRIDQFVELFMELVKTEYDGKIWLAYRNRLNIQAAYLWEISSMLREMANAKKEAKKTSEQKK